MHQSYFVLRDLGHRLNNTLVGCRVYSCYSQDKDELVIQFMGTEVEYYLHAILRPNFSMIRVPENLTRAKRNSIELFNELRDAKVTEVYCIENERCICIALEHNLSVLFKMFGHQSNVLICRNGIPFKIFKNNLKNDLSLTMDKLGRSITLNRDTLDQYNGDFTKVWPALGGKVKTHIISLGYHQMDATGQLALLKSVQKQLTTPEFFIYRQDNIPCLTLFKPDSWILRTKDVFQALNEFFLYYVRWEQLQKLKKEILTGLERKKKKAEGVVRKSEQRLKQLQQSSSYRKMADIIMANLHEVPANATLVQLPDFDTGRTISIKLKATLSPQKNAEQYYRKSKNQSKEVQVLKHHIEINQAQLLALESHLVFVRACEQLKALKQYSNDHGLLSSKSATDSKPPFREFFFNGFRIFIGKSAANNDLLTQKYAHKDDLWLHAKDVKGSHVVVKQKPGQPFPQSVIEKAAQLAAFYSKRKHDSLCPVVYTPKKYVRKRKGAAAGEVVVDREKVVLVTPEAGSFGDSNFK